jgi:hypothetical protein
MAVKVGAGCPARPRSETAQNATVTAVIRVLEHHLKLSSLAGTAVIRVLEHHLKLSSLAGRQAEADLLADAIAVVPEASDAVLGAVDAARGTTATVAAVIRVLEHHLKLSSLAGRQAEADLLADAIAVLRGLAAPMRRRVTRQRP